MLGNHTDTPILGRPVIANVSYTGDDEAAPEANRLIASVVRTQDIGALFTAKQPSSRLRTMTTTNNGTR